MSQKICFSTDGKIGTLKIDNESKRNSLSSNMLKEMNGTLARVIETDLRALLITGAGDETFCSGYNIEEFFDEKQRDRGMDLFEKMISNVKELELPTIAMINGDTIGGGVELITACDLRVTADHARFGITPAKLGIVYRGNGLKQFIDIIGVANTKELLFTANLVESDRAKEMGMVNYVVEEDDLEDRCNSIAEDIAQNAPLSVRYMKEIINTLVSKNELSEKEEKWVDRLQNETLESQDHKEAIKAFDENRVPEFGNR